MKESLKYMIAVDQVVDRSIKLLDSLQWYPYREPALRIICFASLDPHSGFDLFFSGTQYQWINSKINFLFDNDEVAIAPSGKIATAME